MYNDMINTALTFFGQSDCLKLHSLAIAIFIGWFMVSNACDHWWGFFRSPTPRPISKAEEVGYLILIRLL